MHLKALNLLKYGFLVAHGAQKKFYFDFDLLYFIFFVFTLQFRFESKMLHFSLNPPAARTNLTLEIPKTIICFFKVSLTIFVCVCSFCVAAIKQGQKITIITIKKTN